MNKIEKEKNEIDDAVISYFFFKKQQLKLK